MKLKLTIATLALLIGAAHAQSTVSTQIPCLSLYSEMQLSADPSIEIGHTDFCYDQQDYPLFALTFEGKEWTGERDRRLVIAYEHGWGYLHIKADETVIGCFGTRTKIGEWLKGRKRTFGPKACLTIAAESIWIDPSSGWEIMDYGMHGEMLK